MKSLLRLGHLLLKADLIHQCVYIGFDMKVSCLFSVRQNFKRQNLKKFSLLEINVYDEIYFKCDCQ